MNKKLVKGLGLTGVVAAGAVVVASSFSFASSCRVADGRGYWEGERGSKYIYSNLVDDKDDGYKIAGKVYVKNEYGQTKYNDGITKGLGKGGNHIHVDLPKGINTPIVVSETKYSNARAVAGRY